MFNAESLNERILLERVTFHDNPVKDIVKYRQRTNLIMSSLAVRNGYYNVMNMFRMPGWKMNRVCSSRIKHTRRTIKLCARYATGISRNPLALLTVKFRSLWTWWGESSPLPLFRFLIFFLFLFLE